MIKLLVCDSWILPILTSSLYLPFCFWVKILLTIDSVTKDSDVGATTVDEPTHWFKSESHIWPSEQQFWPTHVPETFSDNQGSLLFVVEPVGALLGSK